MTIRVGVCGLGAMGLLFTQLLHHHPAVGEVPVAELDGGLRQLLNDSGLVSRSLESFDQLVDSDLDAVAIFTPPWTHADMAVRALEAGKHALSACPAALSMEEVGRLVDAVERSGQIYVLAETHNGTVNMTMLGEFQGGGVTGRPTPCSTNWSTSPG